MADWIVNGTITVIPERQGITTPTGWPRAVRSRIMEVQNGGIQYAFGGLGRAIKERPCFTLEADHNALEALKGQQVSLNDGGGTYDAMLDAYDADPVTGSSEGYYYGVIRFVRLD